MIAPGTASIGPRRAIRAGRYTNPCLRTPPSPRSSRCAASPSASPASSPSTASTSCSAPARSTPSWARTAPASPRSSRRSPASTRSTPARSPSPASPRIFTQHRRRAGRRHLDRVPGGQPLREPLGRRERHARPRAAHARGGIDWKAVHREAARHLDSLGLQIDTRSILSSHSIAIQQLVAISRAMVLDAKVLILDEPTSSLDRGEVEQLFAVIRDLRDRGVAVLFVSHFLDQVYEISDRITVLRNGQLVGEYLVGDLPRGELVTQDDRPRARRARRDLPRPPTARSTAPTTPVLRASGVGRRGVLEPSRPRRLRRRGGRASPAFSAPAAPSSSACCTAPTARTPGTIEVNGKAVEVSTPRHAIDQRIAFSSEDRRAEGIIADLTVAENIVLGIQARRGWLRKVGRAEQDAVVVRVHDGARRAPRRPESAGRATSPAATSRRCCSPAGSRPRPSCIILDEPTRGIDVGAKADIQRKVAELVRARTLRDLHLLRARRSASIGAARRRDARPAQDRGARIPRPSTSTDSSTTSPTPARGAQREEDPATSAVLADRRRLLALIAAQHRSRARRS